MPVRRETLSLLRELRQNINAIADGQTRALTIAWARAWDDLAAEFERAIEAVIADNGGRWPGRARVVRARRVIAALTTAEERLRRLLGYSDIGMRQAITEAVRQTATGQAGMIASQLPEDAGDAAALRVRFDRVDPQALEVIVERTTQQITSLFRPLSAEATEAMIAELIRGVAVGDNPRTAARLMLRRLEGTFNGGLGRALNIARTEMLDAARLASLISQRANSDVVDGWQWVSALDRRTCPSCWSKHGTIYPLDQPGPNDHQMGRCTGVPVTKSWAALGFKVKEPPSAVPDARTRFFNLSERSQLAIMGPGRLELLQAGEIGWSDLATLRRTRGWRESWVPTPIRDLPRRSAAA